MNISNCKKGEWKINKFKSKILKKILWQGEFRNQKGELFTAIGGNKEEVKIKIIEKMGI